MRGFLSLWTMYTEGPGFHHQLTSRTKTGINTLQDHRWYDMTLPSNLMYYNSLLKGWL